MDAPKAPRRELTRREHGIPRTDPWAWIRDHEDPEVLALLRAENDWAEHSLDPFRETRNRVLAEMRGRVTPNESSAPVQDGPFVYRWRYRKGEEYASLCRRPADDPGAREISLLDGNQLAARAHGSGGDGYFRIGEVEMTPKHDRFAYAVDTVGRRIYEIRFRDAATGEDLPDRIPGAAPNFVWSADAETLLYTEAHPETLRWHRIRRHRLGTPAEADETVFEEADEAFWISVFESRSRELLIIHCSQTERAETWSVPARRPEESPRLVLPREDGHEFDLDHFRGQFFIRTNREAPDFRLVAASEESPQTWRDIEPADPGTHLEDFQLFDTHLALFERAHGRKELRLVDWETGESRRVPLPGAIRSLDEEANPEPGRPEIRVVVSNPKTPPTTFAVDLASGRRRAIKRERVPTFDSRKYRLARLTARAKDGTRIPISLVHHRDHPPGPDRPLLLYGYGAYGISMDPAFSLTRLSLLDRRFVVATAHVRGGMEMGRRWYDEGRLLEKTNTFHDFIACAERLRDIGRCDPRRMYAMGGSAGGLLVGAALNLRPDLFHGVVAMVPFVDVVNTMLDPDIPLTTGEYDEWGDPADPRFFRLMLSYAPYENVPQAALPHVLATSGLHDSQVQFWEPTKWVQRLRERNTAKGRLILLRTNLDAGHGGRSGRYRGLEEVAEIHSFLIGLAGMVTPAPASSLPAGT